MVLQYLRITKLNAQSKTRAVQCPTLYQPCCRRLKCVRQRCHLPPTVCFPHVDFQVPVLSAVTAQIDRVVNVERTDYLQFLTASRSVLTASESDIDSRLTALTSTMTSPTLTRPSTAASDLPAHTTIDITQYTETGQPTNKH